MNQAELDNSLPIVNGALTLTASSLPGAPLDQLLAAYNGSQPLVISNAQKQSNNQGVSVTGTAPFMNVPSLNVIANFALDATGTPTATLRFHLIEAQPGPNSWRFSQSFPRLPVFTKDNTPPQPAFLDTLSLSQSAFVLTTLQSGQDDVTNAPLSFGLNFVGRLTPTGLTGLFDALLGGSETITLYGQIIIPSQGQVTPPLLLFKSPWEMTWTVPGIHLQADLGIGFTLASTHMRFGNTKLHIYSPLTVEWLNDNGTYMPMTAVTGSLDVPSANISLNLTAKLQQNVQAMTLAGTFDGVSLENLGKLADLSGGSDLLSLLPDELRSSGQTLGALSLEALGISFTDSLSPSDVYITVGMPGVQLASLPGFTVEGVAANFAIGQPFSGSSSIYTTLDGTIHLAGAPLDVSIEMPDMIGRATLKENTSLPLSVLFEQLSLPSPPDLTINTIDLFAVPGQGYTFNAILADSPSWELDLGPTPMTIKDVQLALSSGTGSTHGSFSGAVQFSDDLLLSMNYTLPGDFIIRADLPEVQLSEIISRMNEIGLDLMPGFDLTLDDSYVLITKQGGDLTFSAATAVENFGLLAFTAQRQGQWGFAAGLDLGSAGLSAIPGLGPLSAFESFVDLEKIMLVVSSLDDANFQFPDMANFNAPELGNGSLRLPAQASGLVRGMNLYASLSTSSSRGFRTLAQFLYIKLNGTVGITLAVSLPDPATNSKLFISVNEEIQSGTTLTGELGFLMQGTDVAVFLLGDLKTQVQGQPLEFDVTALVLENGVLITGSMKGTISFGPVQLSNLALIIGMSFEAMPSFGIAATLDISDFDSSLAIFFDSVDPAKSMVSGAVSNLTLLSVVKAIAGQNDIPSVLTTVLDRIGLKGLQAFTVPASAADALANALDNRDLNAISAAFQQYGSIALPTTSNSILLVINTKGSVWHITDMSTMLHYSLSRQDDGTIEVDLEAQYYCAPQTTFIGTIQFPEGFHVFAEIDYLILKEQITILINPNTGIAAEVDVSPIVIYNQDFFALTGAKGQGGPRLSLSTFEQPNLEDKNLRDPHFMMTGDLRVLGADISDVYVSISESGMTFQLSEQVYSFLSIELNGKFDSLTNLVAYGNITVGIDRGLDLGPLGSVDVDVSVNGSLGMSYQDGNASASFQGGFDFEGVGFNLPEIQLDVKGPALPNIADTLWGYIADAISKFLQDPAGWLKWLSANIIFGIQSVEDIGRVLGGVYNLNPIDIAGMTSQIMKFDVGPTALVLKAAGVAAEEAVNSLQSFFPADQIASVIPDIFPDVHVDTTFGHVDTPSGPHTDTPGAPHVDGSGPHADFSSHVDEGWGFAHVDSGHTDTAPHMDTEAYPHVDEQVHADTATHIDT